MRKMSRICFHPFFEDKTYIHISSICKMVSKFRNKNRQFCDFLGTFSSNDHQKVISHFFFATFEPRGFSSSFVFKWALRPELPLWQTGGNSKAIHKYTEVPLQKITKNMNAACNNHIYATVIFKQISKSLWKIWEHNTTGKSRPSNGAGRVILALHQLSCRLRHSEA